MRLLRSIPIVTDARGENVLASAIEVMPDYVQAALSAAMNGMGDTSTEADGEEAFAQLIDDLAAEPRRRAQ